MPPFATTFRARSRSLRLGDRTQVMGILNVTPDSFSDGGKHESAESAIARGLEMEAEGADWIDVGGESTRPGAAPVSVAEELRRVIPVIAALAGRKGVLISVDTQKAEVAQAAIEAGADVVNDVGAAQDRRALWRVLAETGAGYILMHMQGTPQTMQIQPRYADVNAEVESFFRERLALMERSGVAVEQTALDVGIGFGKTVEHNLRLLGGLGRLHALHRPLVVGASRKSFIGEVSGGEVSRRLPGSLAAAIAASAAGAAVVRVHDVAATVQALRVAEAIRVHSH